jgi:hypothetical protein
MRRSWSVVRAHVQQPTKKDPMAKKHPGRLWFKFTLFGLAWEARLFSPKKAAGDLKGLMGQCDPQERVVYVADDLSFEQARITLAHEIQHAIEDAADVDFSGPPPPPEIHDRWTDNMARGWVYIIRTCPELLKFLQGEPSKLTR